MFVEKRVYDANAQFPGHEFVLLQGVIDCLIGEGEGYILVDWKTDATTTDPEEIKRRYKTQLSCML